MRSAISMIELVIAIVVMGIVVASTPLLIQQTNSSTTMSVVRQESIMEASAQVWRAMIRDWDRNSYDAAKGKAYVVSTDSKNKYFRDRNGTSKKAGRRSKKSDENATLVDQKATSVDGFGGVYCMVGVRDIDDLNGITINLHEKSNNIAENLQSAGELDYVFSDANDVNVTMAVTYMDDRFAGAKFNDKNVSIILNPASIMPNNKSSNIKVIATTISVTDVDGDGNTENTVLYSFASNIGESSSSKIVKYAP